MCIVAAGLVLHARYVKLGNDAGSIEVLGRPSLTMSAGAHPLFNGVRRLTIAGLTDEPTVMQLNNVTSINSGGVQLSFRGAEVNRRAQTVTIHLRKPPQ